MEQGWEGSGNRKEEGGTTADVANERAAEGLSEDDESLPRWVSFSPTRNGEARRLQNDVTLMAVEAVAVAVAVNGIPASRAKKWKSLGNDAGNDDGGG